MNVASVYRKLDIETQLSYKMMAHSPGFAAFLKAQQEDIEKEMLALSVCNFQRSEDFIIRYAELKANLYSVKSMLILNDELCNQITGE